MKSMSVRAFLFFFSLILSAVFAESPAYLDKKKVKIDGKTTEWSAKTLITKEFGEKGIGKGPFDIAEMHMAYNHDDILFRITTKVDIDKFKGTAKFKLNKNYRIFEVFIDKDQKTSTGCKKNKYQSRVIVGYNHRYILESDLNLGFNARSYVCKNTIREGRKQIKVGATLQMQGRNIEFKIPLKDVGVSPTGTQKVRILLYENSSGSFSEAKYTLNFGKSSSSQKNQPETEESEKETSSASQKATSQSGFTIWHLMFIALWIIAFLCALAIAPKAGLPAWVALLNLLPFIGLLAFLFVLAFKPWPLHIDYAHLERELQERHRED